MKYSLSTFIQKSITKDISTLKMYFFSPVPIIKVLILLVCPLKRIHDMNVKIFVILIIFFILLSLRGVLRLCIFPSSILHDSKITRQYNDIMFLYKFLSKYQTTINNNNNNKNTPNENVLIILEINPRFFFITQLLCRAVKINIFLLQS